MVTAATAIGQNQAPAVNLKQLKARQQDAWSSGDYAVIGTTLQIVGEQLCEALDLRAGQRVLDVAAGNGNATLAAARRWCEVVSTDYVPTLLEGGRRRAAAEGLSVTFQEADAEALPFGTASFDVVLSSFGVMFTPDQDAAAAELVRVVRGGGKIGLANWTPQGFIGSCSRPWRTICRRRPAPSRRRYGARGRGWARCLPAPPPPSRPSRAISCFAIDRRNTSWTCSRPTMARCARRLPRSMRRGSRRSAVTCWR